MDIAPFKNILNEFYSRNISRKIISVKNIRVRQGKFEEQSEKTSVKLRSKLENKQKRYNEIGNLFVKVYDDYLKGLLDEEKLNLI